MWLVGEPRAVALLAYLRRQCCRCPTGTVPRPGWRRVMPTTELHAGTVLRVISGRTIRCVRSAAYRDRRQSVERGRPEDFLNECDAWLAGLRSRRAEDDALRHRGGSQHQGQGSCDTLRTAPAIAAFLTSMITDPTRHCGSRGPFGSYTASNARCVHYPVCGKPCLRAQCGRDCIPRRFRLAADAPAAKKGYPADHRGAIAGPGGSRARPRTRRHGRRQPARRWTLLRQGGSGHFAAPRRRRNADQDPRSVQLCDPRGPDDDRRGGGLDAAPGRHLLIADDAPDMGKNGLMLIDSPEMRTGIGNAGNALYEKRYSAASLPCYFSPGYPELSSRHEPGW